MIRNNHLNFNELLASSLNNSTKKGEFDPSKFFKKWYAQEGKAFFFLFKKNLHVTNIQFAELLSLLQAHTTCSRDNFGKDLQFVSTKDFQRWVGTLINTLTPVDGKPNYVELANLYGDIFQRTIIVDSFYTSCSVFLPPFMDIDAVAICGYSGYIHSCGANVFIRKMTKTRKEHLFNALTDYLKTLNNEKKKVFFAVYAHEDFTKFDRKLEQELRDGLDDVKIYIEKFYMGRESLVSVLRKLKKEFINLLEIPDPGDFRITHSHSTTNVDTARTLWLIKDYAIDSQSLHKTSDAYFICYDQHYINENHFHIFDENKPAWVSHTTIPHTLLAAMINITRPSLHPTQRDTLCDPFVGSGTTWLEAMKYNDIDIQCSDLSPIAALLAQDNADFFSKSDLELHDLGLRLSGLADYVNNDSQQETEPLLLEPDNLRCKLYKPVFEWAKNLSEKADNITAAIVNQLTKHDFFDRIVFYLWQRTRLRNIGAFERQSKDWNKAYIYETKTLGVQIANLEQLRKKQAQPLENKTKATNLCVYQSKYSLACCPSIKELKKAYQLCMNDKGVNVLDARKLKADSCSVIVTDPPYGFNTNDDPAKLAEIWTQALEAMILALKHGGQLVLCLPDQSHTGRDLQFFTQREFIINQVLSIAANVGREPSVLAHVVPSPARLYRAPFYWESERALRRAILHFTFWHKDGGSTRIADNA